MAEQSTIEDRIAQTQAKIEVPSYQDVAWEGAWKRRAAAIWGVGAVGLAVGVVIGALAPLAPFLVQAAPLSLALIGKSVAVFAALGISAGMTIGAVMGPAAGGVASVMKEYERRQIAREIEQKMHENPDLDVELLQRQAAMKEEDRPKSIRLADYFNLKTGLAFTAIGAIGGLVFGAALLATGGLVPAAGMAANGMISQLAMPAAQFLLGTAATNPVAVMAYSVGLGGLFGANFGVSHPIITRHAIETAGDLLSGKTLGTPWPKRVNQPALHPVVSPAVVAKPSPAVEVEAEEVGQQKPQAKLSPRAAYLDDIVNRSIRETDTPRARV